MVGLGLGSLSGCDNKVPQCNQMVEILNAAAEKMESYKPEGEDFKKNAEAASEMSRLAQSTGSKLEGVDLKDETLKGFRTQYLEILKHMAAHTQAMSDAMLELTTVQPDAEKANDKLRVTRESIETLCQTATESCQKISDAMASVPSEPAEDEVAAVLKTYGEKLSGLELEDPLKAAVAKHVEAVEAFRGLVNKATEQQQKAEEADQELSTVIESEKKLVDQLNRYCSGGS